MSVFGIRRVFGIELSFLSTSKKLYSKDAQQAGHICKGLLLAESGYATFPLSLANSSACFMTPVLNAAALPKIPAWSSWYIQT
jgi:hypothetical protein